jgi:hypothetical protein
MISASTGVHVPDRPTRGQPAPSGRAPLAGLLLGGGVLGALLLAISQFMTLAATRVAGNRVPVESITVGSDHAYALLPVALVAAALAYGVWSAGSRPALLAIGLLGAVSLVIALARDLPDAHSRGFRLSAGHLVAAANSISAGLYVETAGALILLITCVCGFLLLGSPTAQRSAPLPDGAQSGQSVFEDASHG